MINKIHIENVATYVSGVEFFPKKINFIYGANGTGKSTLSKVINNDISSAKCSITWDADIKEDIVVYNRDFVEKNFQTDKQLKGIFSLGEESIEIQKEMEDTQKKIDEIHQEVVQKQHAIDVLSQEQDDLKSQIEQKCWQVQTMYGAEFADALIGFRNRKSSFCQQCIECSEKLVEANVLSLEEIRMMYQIAFSNNASKDDKYKTLPLTEINALDTNKLLNIVIIGKSDTPIGSFIEYLKASDWVKTGIEYARRVPGKCPYCQRSLPQNIQEDIESYFDKKYEDDKAELYTYEQLYNSMVSKIKGVVQEIDNKRYSYINYEEFDEKKTILISKLEKKQLNIQYKIKFLSKVVEIESVIDIASELAGLIEQFNVKIAKNNELVENQGQAKTECKDKLWDFLTNQCIKDIRNFKKDFDGKEKGKQNIFKKKKQKEDKIKELRSEIEARESSLTSVKPTVDSINHLLKEFGFNGFLLEGNDDKTGTYKIVRPSGEDASKTLSEGEHNFISFLYFYHLCFGSQTRIGLESKKVLVIDDPISSMDSNVLFIVSTLVKDIIKNCKDNTRGINQIILLTHNVYFHKEITFWGNRNALPSMQTRYYILRKVEEETTIQEYDTNPIKNSYELLWRELKNDTVGSANLLMNVMRRILEYYFTIIGGIDYEKCINQFEGGDKIICKSLISFINDGSHSVFEDLVFTPDDGDIENYKRAFKLLFYKLGHSAHYKMMMGEC